MANDLTLKIIMSATDKVSATFNRIRTSSSALSGALRKQNQELKRVNQTIGKAERFADLQRKTEAAAEKSRALAKEISTLSAEIAKAGRPTQAQARHMQQLEAKSQAAARKEQELRDKTRALSIELKKAGFDTRHFAQEQVRMTAAAAKANRELERQRAAVARVNAAQKSYQGAQTAAGKLRSVSATSAVAGAAVTAGVGRTVMDAVNEEDAMLGVIRQVQGLKNADNSLNHEEIAKVREEIRGLSHELPLATTEIMAMYEAGARMDTPRKELAGYVRTAAEAATAFDADNVEELAESLGRIKNNFRLSAEQARELADVINYLDDNAISKGTDIIGYMNRVSGSMGLARISDKNTAALGSTLLSQGIDESTAAAAVSSLFTRLSSAPNMKPVRNALQQIGLDARAVQKGMVEDANATLEKIIDAVKRMPKEQQAGILKGLAGGDYNKVFAGLVANTEEWQRQMKLANSQDAIGSMAREFETRMGAMSSKWQVFKNQLFNTSATAGSLLFTSLGGLMERLGGVLDKFNAWMQANPKTAAAIMKTVAVVGVLLIVFAAITAAIAAVIVPLAALKLSWVTLAAGAEGSSGKIGLLTRAFGLLRSGLGNLIGLFASNPILLVIAAIVAGLYLLYTHWETVKNALVSGWNWVNQVFANNPILNIIFPFIGIARAIVNNWGIIGPWFAGMWAKVKGFFSGGIGNISAQIVNWSPLGLFYRAFAAVLDWFGIKLPATLSDAGRKLVQGLIDGIKSMLPNISAAWRSVTSVFNGSAGTARAAAGAAGKSFGGNIGGLAGMPPMRRYASGGYTGAGGRYEAAGIVDKGEVVFNQTDVRRFGGWRVLEAIRRGGMRVLNALHLGSLGGSFLDSLGNFAVAMLGGSGLPGIVPPPAGAATASGSLSGSGSITVNVYAAPGMDERRVGEIVMQKLAQWQAAGRRRANSSFSDKD